jgi:transposase-like protein
MVNFSPQEKIQAVKTYLNGNEGIKTVAESIGVSSGVFHNWVKQYEFIGEAAFEKRYTSYSAEYKLDVLNYMNEHGTSIRKTVAIFNIPSPETLRKWKIALESEGYDALQSKKKGRQSMKDKVQKATKKQEGSMEALQMEIERLRMENAYLKKLNALVQNKEKSPNKTKPK